MKKPKPDDLYPDKEIERRRDETMKRMIAMAPKTLKGAPKRAGGSGKKKSSGAK